MQAAEYPEGNEAARRERRQAYMREYRQRNKKKLAAQKYAWRERNPVNAAAIDARQARRRSIIRRKRPPAYPELPEDFGHWLAGFIDGEGYFVITRNNCAKPGLRVHFGLSLRADDLPILQRCVEMTGVGSLHRRPNRPRAGKTCKPTIQWFVVSKHDCQRLVEILDRFPLRAKKARDYAIWREAVAAHAQIRSGHPPQGEPAWDWEPLRRLRERLIAGRVYVDPTPDRSHGKKH